MFEQEAKEIDDEITQLVVARLKQKNEQLISSDNELHYSHGGTWSHVDAATGSTNSGTFVEQSADATVPLTSLVNNDATIILRFVEELAEAMHANVARSVYTIVGEAAESVGNTVQFAAPSDISEEEEDAQLTANLDALFQKIELGVDRHGLVSYPQLHLSPDNTKMLRALRRKAAEPMSEDTERMIERKEVEARGREAERLRRYRRP